MARTNVIYSAAGLYTGPAPSTGYHFITFDGTLNNNYAANDTNLNLIFPIYRIQSINYSVSEQRSEIATLGKRANLSYPAILPPQINLNFNYLQMGLINEARLGFYVNHPSGDPITGLPLYTNPNATVFIDNSGNFFLTQDGNNLTLSSGTPINYVCPISGFIDRSYQPSNDTPQGWPLTYRDSRNIFVAIRNDSSDLINSNNSPTLNTEIGVLGFGDCVINSYKTSASVGELPTCSVEYLSYNMNYYASGSGLFIPSVNTKDFSENSSVYFNIPKHNDIPPTVLLPSNLSLSIDNVSVANGNNLLLDINDIKIQSYEISLNLNRDSLQAIGNVLPLDRRIKFPVYAKLNFNVTVGDSQTGSFVDLIKKDNDYNINIGLNYSLNQGLTGLGVLYSFIGAKYEGCSFSHSISNYKTASLSFTTEIDPNNRYKGFFISGLLGIENLDTVNSIHLGDNFNGDPTFDNLLMEDTSIFTILAGQNNNIIY